jgi:hypothetical protein
LDAITKTAKKHGHDGGHSFIIKVGRMRRVLELRRSEHLSFLQYAGTSRFWFESFQNWQSEFLSIAAMVVLSIFLRQRGSPESKPVDSPHDQTASE